jgi:hypothetical protein
MRINFLFSPKKQFSFYLVQQFPVFICFFRRRKRLDKYYKQTAHEKQACCKKLSSVDFPVPLRPIIPSLSPGFTSKDTSFSSQKSSFEDFS